MASGRTDAKWFGALRYMRYAHTRTHTDWDPVRPSAKLQLRNHWADFDEINHHNTKTLLTLALQKWVSESRPADWVPQWKCTSSQQPSHYTERCASRSWRSQKSSWSVSSVRSAIPWRMQQVTGRNSIYARRTLEMRYKKQIRLKKV